MLMVSLPFFTVANTPPPPPVFEPLAENVAVYPSGPFPTVMILMIPPTPSASYFGPGFVITSTFLMLAAGILFNTSLGLLVIMLFGLPFTYALNDELPFTFTLSCPSTLTIGTFFSISITVFTPASGSSSTLYVSLSMSAFTSGLYATTSTPFSSVWLSVASSFPRSMVFDVADTVNALRMSFLPIDLTMSRYSPSPVASMLKRPSASVTAIFSGFVSSPFLTMLSVAYGSPALVSESVTTPFSLYA